MVARTGTTQIFYTHQYAEARKELKMFDSQDPQKVIAEFGETISTVHASKGVLIQDLAVDSTYLYARRGLGNANDKVQRFLLQTPPAAPIPIAGEELDLESTTPMAMLRPLTDFPQSPQLPTGITEPANPPPILAKAAFPPSSVPTGYQLIAVYYGAPLNQVYIYNSAGVKQDVIGVAGGYDFGPAVPRPSGAGDASFKSAVKLNSLYYDGATADNRAVVGYQPDGKLWIADAVTSRMLLFDTDRKYLTQIMYAAQSYRASADPNAPSRVFSQFLEFDVDYSRPTSDGWKLSNYWGHLLYEQQGSTAGSVGRSTDGTLNGLLSVTTIPGNGRTFGFIYDPTGNPGTDSRLVELVSSDAAHALGRSAGLRKTSIERVSRGWDLDQDGKIRYIGSSNTISLNGANQYADTPANYVAFPTTALTVEFWMKTSDPNTSRSGTPIGYVSPTDARQFFISDYDNFQVKIGSNPAYRPASPVVSANDGQWHHIAVTWRTPGISGNNVALYKDGQFQWSTRLSGANPFSANGYFVVGCKNRCLVTPAQCTAADAFIGQLYDVRVWEVERTQTQINNSKSILSASDPQIGNLRGRWLFHHETNPAGDPQVEDVGSGANPLLLRNGATRVRWLDSFYSRTLSISTSVTLADPEREGQREMLSALDPITAGESFKTYANKFFVFNGDPGFTGKHLAAVPINPTQNRDALTWAKIDNGYFDGKGKYETRCEPVPTGFVALGSDIIVAHRAETWRGGQKQGNQMFHYRASDGALLGQFGMPLTEVVTIHAPGTASNLHKPGIVRVGNAVYIYTNDEGGRGVHRWKLTPADLR